MNYTYGFKIDGMDVLENRSVKDSCIITYGKETSVEKLESFICMNNRVILLVDYGKINNSEELCSILVRNNMYDIYEVDMSIVDIEYIYAVIERKSSISEIGKFISNRIAVEECAEDTINSIVRADSMEQVYSEVIKNEDALKEIPKVIDNQKEQIVKLNTRINELKQDINQLEQKQKEDKSKEYTEKLVKVNEELENTNKKIKELEKELDNSKESEARAKKELNIEINKKYESNDGVVLCSSYETVLTSDINVACRVSTVLYFKEISYVKYTNTLILSLCQFIKSKKAGTIVKILIYDDKAGMTKAYENLSVITFKDFNNNRDKIIRSDILVVVEPVISIIKEMIASDCDILIVYDRMKLSKDIIDGNNVYKWWVLNNPVEAPNITGNIMPYVGYISRPEVEKANVIGVPVIEGYKEKTGSAKIKSYAIAKNRDGKGESTIFSIIDKAASLKLFSV